MKCLVKPITKGMVHVLKFYTPTFVTKWNIQNSAGQDQTALERDVTVCHCTKHFCEINAQNIKSGQKVGNKMFEI